MLRHTPKPNEKDIAYSAEQRKILQDYQNMAAAKVESYLVLQQIGYDGNSFWKNIK